MRDVLQFFNLGDALPLLLLIWLLHFVGGQMNGDNAAVVWWARGVAAAGFLFYAGGGIATWTPTKAVGFLTVGLQALLAMGTAHGLALVILPVLRFFYQHLWAQPLERQRVLAEDRARRVAAENEKLAVAAQHQAARERRAEEERRKQEEIARRPPPPSREERLTAARKRYDHTLHLLASASLDDTELHAARERAKQQYLREMDEVMK